MRVRCHILVPVFLILVNCAYQQASAQLGFDLKIDKPKPFENRVLKAEKTNPDKPLKAQKRFFQNLTTHYNYFFNANNKLNEVIGSAKAAHKDDYTSLLPFYNYSLDVTAQNTKELDSVIYKSQTGIVMHDLRNDWADNLYLLWGAAWFFEKKFDSASLMFQFINYSFAEKEKDGYYRYIGSRMDGNNALSISTKENRSFPKNTVTPPSRNNAFIWQARTMIENGNTAEAGSLIATLKNDPLFPSRLKDDLEELEAYWYYRQGAWDSSAAHLQKALGQAQTKQERARWEYLIAQMLERTGKFEKAQKFYTKAIGHTTDPVMDVYARLNIVRVQKDSSTNYIDKNIAELLKMARRDKYTDYRDVIYFMAAQMELERNNIAAAEELFLKSSKYNNGNLGSKNKAFLMIADLSYDQKKWAQAARFYDSVLTDDMEKPETITRVQIRKELLSRIIGYTSTISKEDSLQRIAAMPEEERNALLNKMVKQLRKQQGLGDDNTISSGNAARNTTTPEMLFPTGQTKGEWYFYNNNLKTQGQSTFKQVWGNRPNVDNWRRFSDVNQQLLAKTPNNTREPVKTLDNIEALDETPSFAKLQAGLPLTPAQLALSNDSLRISLFELGKVYLNEAEDFPLAIETFEELRRRFPDFKKDEILFYLNYAYKKAGNEPEADKYKRLLLNQQPDSRFATILSTGSDPAKADSKNSEATKAYEGVYDLFISGQFENALAAKKMADSIYRTNYWQPQLLYIESAYHIKQRNDSVAIDVLQTLIAQDPNAPMAQKAQVMIDVLNRRAEIEDELTRLQITRPAEDSVVMPVVNAPTPLVQQPRRDSMLTQPPVKQDVAVVPPKMDSITILKDTVATAIRKDTAVAKPANETVKNLPKPDTLATAKKDTTTSRPKQEVVKNIPKKDTVVRKPVVNKPASIYDADTAAKYFAVVILEKVDALFVVEVKNAFHRYNREKHGHRPLTVDVKEFDGERQLLLIGEFNGARDVTDYLQVAKPRAVSEIIPWLRADKYSFTVINAANIGTLFNRKDLTEYRKFLDQNLPVKF